MDIATVIGFLIGLFLVGWLNKILAEERGRNVTLWIILALLFGIFSSLILFLLKPTQAKQDELYEAAKLKFGPLFKESKKDGN